VIGVEAELFKQLKELSPISLGIIALIYAMRKLPGYSLEKMKHEATEKDKILVHLNEQVEKMNKDMDEMKEELLEYRKKFFDLEADHAKLKREYDELKGVLKSYEQKKTKH
jgi:predicted  nucleic acid-binding Zn-ribbon protein